MDNYNYPEGSDISSAPWNMEENTPKEFEVTVTCSLDKNVTVVTSNYILEIEKDEDGINEIINTEDTCWEEVYNENHYTIEDLLKEFSEILKYHIDTMDESLITRKIHYQRLLEECSNWVTNDFIVTE